MDINESQKKEAIVRLKIFYNVTPQAPSPLALSSAFTLKYDLAFPGSSFTIGVCEVCLCVCVDSACVCAGEWRGGRVNESNFDLFF